MNSKNNILLGLDADNKKLFVENNDYRHIMLIAPHGSGKGVCFVTPSIWRGLKFFDMNLS